MDGILFVRQVEAKAGQRRLLSLLKLREGRYDSAARELAITASGLVVGAAGGSGQAGSKGGTVTNKSVRSPRKRGRG